MDFLSDDLLLHILNYVSSQGDVKSLVRFTSVSRRFRLLVPLVPSVLIHLDLFNHAVYRKCGSPFPFFSGRNPPLFFSRSPFTSLLIRELLSDLLSLSAVPPLTTSSSPPVAHRAPPHVIKNFPCLRTLRVVFPSGELCLGDGSSILLCWRAHFGSSLKRGLILTVANISSPRTGCQCSVAAPKDTIPDSLRTDLSRTLTKYTLSGASRRQRMLWPMIAEHKTLESLEVTDADGQGVLLMDRDQLKERRKEDPITKIPDVRMWEWYAPVIKLSSGSVLEGVMVVAILPWPRNGKEQDIGLGWIKEEFDCGMHAEAVRVLVDGTTTHRYHEISGQYY